jgi:predicted PurR-regulated permease PerM
MAPGEAGTDARRIIAAQRAHTVALFAALVLAWLLWQLREVALLVAFSVLIAYALDPVVERVQRIPLGRSRHLPRGVASALVMLVIVALVGWALSLAVPQLAVEISDFVRRLPDNIQRVLTEVRLWAGRNGLGPTLEPALQNAQANIGSIVQWVGAFGARWIGRLAGGLVQSLGLLVIPVLAFYLLAERDDVKASVLGFVPAAAHDRLAHVQGAVDRALKSYVRGQAIVCLVMGVATALALMVLGHPFALLLGVIAAIAEIVPYLGAVVVVGAITVAGIGQGWGAALTGVIAYVVVNNLIAFLVTPRIMGRHLKMHPFIVTVAVLAGAQLLGAPGALVALPGAAVLLALIAEVAAERRTKRPARPKRGEDDET